MFCIKCGQNLPEDAVFCSKCGTKVGQSTGATPSDKVLHLKCSNCGGSMSVDADRPVLTCPYCGASDLINESDNVTIQRIRSKAYRDVQLGEQQSQKEIEVARIKADEDKEIMKNKTQKFGLILWYILAFVMMVIFFSKVS